MNTIRMAALAGCLLALTAACARPSGGTEPGAGTASYPADALVLRVAYVGGFTMPTELASRLPVLSVYGDGRVLTPSPHTAVFPGPALPAVELRHIEPAGIAKLVALAQAAGVGEPADFGQPQIVDAASTSFTMLTEKGRKTSQVYALSEADERTVGITMAQQSARTKLRRLLIALTDLPKTLGAGAIDEAMPYRPTTLAAIAVPFEPSGGPYDNAPELNWPGAALPGASANTAGVGCVAVSGDQLPSVLAAAETANTATRWRSGDRLWTLTLRPLLPDETGCTDLPPK